MQYHASIQIKLVSDWVEHEIVSFMKKNIVCYKYLLREIEQNVNLFSVKLLIFFLFTYNIYLSFLKV